MVNLKSKYTENNNSKLKNPHLQFPEQKQEKMF